MTPSYLEIVPYVAFVCFCVMVIFFFVHIALKIYDLTRVKNMKTYTTEEMRKKVNEIREKALNRTLNELRNDLWITPDGNLYAGQIWLMEIEVSSLKKLYE